MLIRKACKYGAICICASLSLAIALPICLIGFVIGFFIWLPFFILVAVIVVFFQYTRTGVYIRTYTIDKFIKYQLLSGKHRTQLWTIIYDYLNISRK